MALDFDKIFKDWFKFSNFNPDTDIGTCYKGNLATYNYQWWELSQRIAELLRDYNSPILAYMLLRKDAESAFTEKFWCIKDFVEGKCKEFITLYKEIYTPEGSEAETTFLEMISKLTAQKNLIGNIDRDTVLSQLSDIIEKANKLKIHPLLVSGNPLGEVEIRNKIRAAKGNYKPPFKLGLLIQTVCLALSIIKLCMM